MPALKIAFLADGAPSIGLGHLMRSLVIAEEFHERGHVVQLIGTGSQMVRSNFPWINAETVIDCKKSFQSAQRLKSIDDFQPDLVIIDGYHYAENLFVQIEKRRIPYGVVDDNGETKAQHPLFIHNQNAPAPQISYAAFNDSHLFLGPSYALIRSSIRTRAGLLKSEREDFVFVSLGGTDVLGLSLRVCETLIQNNHRVHIALGLGVMGRDSAISAIRQLDGVTIVEQADYARELSEARLVVTASGTSLWEAICLGKPAVALIVADNQVGPASRASELTDSIRVVDVRKNRDKVEEIPKLIGELLCVGEHNASLSRELARGTSRLVDGILNLVSSECEKAR